MKEKEKEREKERDIIKRSPCNPMGHRLKLETAIKK
jgi:hypothetical protein